MKSLCAVAAAASAGALVAACGSRTKDAPDAGAAADTAPSASASARPRPSASADQGPSALSKDAGANADGGPDFGAGECPDFEPARWTPYEGYAADLHCWTFTPTSKELMPRPYVWEPCEREEFGAKCRRIKLAPREVLAFPHGIESRTAIVNGRAPVKIEVARSCAGSKSTIFSIADVDGPTQVAVANDAEYPCEFNAWTMREGYQLEAKSQRPDEQGRTDDWGGTQMVPVDLPRAMLAYGSVTPKLIGGLELTSLHPKALGEYAKGDAVARRAMRIGEKQEAFLEGDGKDLVWSFANAAEPGQCVLLRAPWSDDPAALAAPTRIGSFPCKEIQSQKMEVGCGFFGATTSDGEAIVVRLKDGVSFHFPKLCGPLDRSSTCDTHALGFSCSEAFFGVGGPKPNVFRVPLDALPGATPPKEPPRPFEDPDAGTAAASDAGAADANAPDGGSTPLDAGR